jgi:serine/threonine protein kinase
MTCQDHILPYLFSQGWPTGDDINIFQPVCEESFGMQIANVKSQDERQTMTTTMFHQISLGLRYIHTYDPPIIHRDVKPSNILYRLGKYLLNDFDIAKTVDSSHTLVGTNSYMAPELWQGGVQGPGLDIYGLGVTIIKALDGFPDLAKRPATWQQWHYYLQTHASESPIASMLATSPDERPTAQEIVRTFFPDSLPAMEWVRIGLAGLSKKIPRLTPRRDVVSRRHKQSGIARAKPAKSTNQERKKSEKLGVSSQNERRARSQSRRRRSGSKSVRESELRYKK